MPKAKKSNLVSIGGKSTEFGKETFLAKAATIRRRILKDTPRYRDLTHDVMAGQYSGSLSKMVDARVTVKKRGKTAMPKAIGNLKSRKTLAGKRGRKSLFDSAEFEFGIGIENALDVTEEMQNLSDDYREKCDNDEDKIQEFLLEMFDEDTRDENVKNWRKSRFDALKRAAKIANGKDSTYSLEIGETEDSEDYCWILVRTK